MYEEGTLHRRTLKRVVSMSGDPDVVYNHVLEAALLTMPIASRQEEPC